MVFYKNTLKILLNVTLLCSQINILEIVINEKVKLEQGKSEKNPSFSQNTLLIKGTVSRDSELIAP